MANIEILDHAGKIIVDSILLTSSDGQKTLDIYGLFDEIEIFEDIYSASIYAKIQMIDGFNLKTNFPILGEEIITFTCHTPTISTKITKKFAVVGMSELSIGTAKKQVYSLDLISIEALIDLHTKVYRAFTGTPSDSATQVFNTYFKPQTNAVLKADESSNTLKIVAPTVSPFKFMSMLANKAIDKSPFGSPNFLFYEDNQNYNFRNLSTLFGQDSLTTFRWSYNQLRDRDAQGKSTRDVKAEYANVKTLNIDRLFNTLDKAMAGSIGHRVIEVDILRKTVAKKTYSYTDNFKDTPHLNGYPTNSPTLYKSKNNDEVVEVSLIHSLHQDNFQLDRDGDVLTKRIPIINQNEFIKLDITTHGRTDLTVGNVVTFEMGKFETIDADKAMTTDAIDQYYSGKYLITAIHHRISKAIHETTMEIVKESFNSKIGVQS